MFEYIRGVIDGYFSNIQSNAEGWVISPYVFYQIESLKTYKARVNKNLNSRRVNKLITEAISLINEQKANQEREPVSQKDKVIIESENRTFIKRTSEIYSDLKSKEVRAAERCRIKTNKVERRLGAYFSGVGMRCQNIFPYENSRIENIAPEIANINPAIVISKTLLMISGYIDTGSMENEIACEWKENKYVS